MSGLHAVNGWTHRYADLSVTQCYVQIKICSLHFNEISFINPKWNCVNQFVVPSLNIKSMNELAK